jgi:hypothetical protein
MSSTLLGSCTHYALRRFVGWAPSRDDPIAGESHVAGNITPTHQIQVGQPTPSKILSAPRVIEASPEHQTPLLSPAAQDCEASCGIATEDGAVEDFQSPPSLLASVIPTPAPIIQQMNT